MDKPTYIQQILTEHLSSKYYMQLTKQEAHRKLDKLRTYLKTLVTSNAHIISKAELTYFDRSFKIQHRIPIFYGLSKVHKTPMTLHPVVSCSNSLMSVFSNWLDHKMKELLPLIQSHIVNSTTVVNNIKNVTLPKEATTFSANAISMYTNIDTDIGLATFQSFFQDNSDKKPNEFQVELFLQLLETVIKK